MKTKLASIGVIIGLFMPVFGFAATIDSSISLTGAYTTGTDSQFNVNLSNFQILGNEIGVLNISDATTQDIKSAMFLDKSGWVKLTPYQSGADVLAKFTADTGFNISDQRVVTLRINFNTAKTYVVGFVLLTNENQTISSAAIPITVAGPQFGNFGQSPTVALTFTRNMGFGSRGSDVTALQNKLTVEGFYTGPVTGFFGRLTQAAIRRYQTAHGIGAIGAVGPQTLSALNQ